MIPKLAPTLNLIKTSALAVTVFLMAACTPVQPGTGEAPETEPLPESTWYLAAIGPVENPVPSLPNHLVTLEFGGDNSAGGSAGCNSFGGKYTVRGDTIAFDNLVTTLMACLEPGLMEQEAAYLAALGQGGRLERSEGALSIFYGEGQVLRFTSAPPVVFADTATPALSPEPSPTPDLSVLCATRTETSEAGWARCENPIHGFSIDYPADAAFTEHTAARARIDLPVAPDTNLLEKYLLISITEELETCSGPLALGFQPGDDPPESVTLAGVPFDREQGSGVATGNLYEWTIYATDRGDTCISFGLILHSFSPGVMENPPPEFDHAAETAVLEPIVESFRWLNGVPTATSAPAATLTPDATADRIQFETGGISATVSAELAPGGSQLYVLFALEGQTMSVKLDFAAGDAILVIWGEDGQPLLTDHAEVSSYEVVLPASQDYFILVKAHPEDGAGYTMTVTIPPPD